METIHVHSPIHMKVEEWISINRFDGTPERTLTFQDDVEVAGRG